MIWQSGLDSTLTERSTNFEILETFSRNKISYKYNISIAWNRQSFRDGKTKGNLENILPLNVQNFFLNDLLAHGQ